MKDFKNHIFILLQDVLYFCQISLTEVKKYNYNFNISSFKISVLQGKICATFI